MKKKLIQGGKMVARGSFGCVYDPPLMCDDEFSRPRGYIGKILTTIDSEKELKEQEVINSLDPDYHYHLKIRRECVPKTADVLDDKELYGCILHNTHLADINGSYNFKKKYRILQIENGGESLTGFFKKKGVFPKIEIDTMIFDFTRILFGLNEMTRTRIGHFDIKTENMVYDARKNRFNYIDFGFLSSFDKFKTHFRNWGLMYWVFPIERVFLKNDLIDTTANFLEHLFEIVKEDRPFKEIEKDDKNRHIKEMKQFLKSNLTNSKFRHENRVKYNVLVDDDDYCIYGFNKNKEANTQFLIEDYMDFIKKISVELKTKDTALLIERFNEENIKKLNVFSIGLVMNALIHFFTEKKISIHLHGEEKIQKTSDTLSKISLHLASFYKLMTQACHPSFPKRISSNELYETFLREVYYPIKKEYSFEQFEFITQETLVDTEKPIELQEEPPVLQENDVRLEVNTDPQQLVNDLTRKVKKVKQNITRKKKECPSDKILNPETKRCIKKTSAKAKKIMKDNVIVIPSSSISSSSLPRINLKMTQKRKTSPPKSQTMTQKKKTCPPEKILNPKTNRCIYKNGVVAKQLIKKGLI